MEDFAVDRKIVLKENLYCQKCGTWVYCPEMNMKCKNDQGEDVECIAEDCLKNDGEREYFECPGCGTRHYLQG